MRLFRQDNTEGYSDAQLEALNAEWEQRVADTNLEPGAEYDFQAKAFCDEVSRREEEIPDEEIIDLSELEQALRDNGLMPGESDGQ